MPWKQWTYLELVKSADLQTYIQNQIIAVFATPAARDASITAPAEGMAAYIVSLKQFQIYNGAAWESSPQAPRSFSTALGPNVAGAGPTTIGTINIPAQPRPYLLEALATWSPTLSVQGDNFTLSTRVGGATVGATLVRSPGANITIPMAVASSQLTTIAAGAAATVTCVVFRVTGTGNAIQDASMAGVQMMTARLFIP